MAKKDPSLQDQDDFDTDFDSMLDRTGGDLDDIDFDIEGLDSDEERKPVTKREILTDSLNVAGRKAGVGAVTGISTGIERAIPEVEDVKNSVVDLASQVEILQSDTVSKIRPLLNQSKNIGRQLLQQVEGFMPKSMYSKILDKLSSNTDASYSTPSKEATRQTAIEEGLNEIFKMQSAAAEESRKEEFVQHAIDEQVDQNRHTEITSLVNDIRNQQIFSTEFTRSTYTAYLKKDLELKYRLLYLNQDLLEVSRLTSQMLEQKLDDIRHNTSLPDYAKIQLIEMGKRKLIESAMQGIGGNLRNYGTKIIGNIKEQFIDPALQGWGMANDALGTFADMIELDDGFNARRSGSGWLGSMAGKFVGKTIGKKFIDNLDPQAKKTLANYLRRGTTGVALLLDDIKTGKTAIPGIDTSSPVYTLLDKILPNLDRSNGTVTNKVYNDPEGHAEITNKFIATVEEVIPGYLSLQTQYLEQLSIALAGDVQAERQTFDFETGTFSRIGALQTKIAAKIQGSKQDRVAIMKSNTSLFREELHRFKGTETATTFAKVERDISLFMMNAAKLKVTPDRILSFEIFKSIAEQASQGKSFDEIDMPKETRTCFRGIKDPIATVNTLLSFFTDVDGSVRADTISAFHTRIYQLIEKVVDSHRAELTKQIGLYGRDVTGDLTTVNEKGDFTYNQKYYDAQYDSLTEKDYDAIDDSQYDEFGFRIEEPNAFDATKNIVGKGAVYLKEKVKGAGALADSVVTKAAVKLGKEQEWLEFKKIIKQKIEVVAKWWSDTKATIKKIGKDILDAVCAKIYDWLTARGDKHEFFLALRDIVFTEDKQLRKEIEARKVANILARVPKLYSVVQAIYKRSRTDPLFKMLWAFLPECLKLLAQLSEKEVNDIINAPEPETLLVTYVDPSSFSDGDDITPAAPGGGGGGYLTTYKSGDDGSDPFNFYDASGEPIPPTLPTDTSPGEAQLIKDVYAGGSTSTSSLNDQDRAKKIVDDADLARANFSKIETSSNPWGAYNEPTIFANGNAVMGEAGPEVIVPMNNSTAAWTAYNQAKEYFEPEEADLSANVSGYTAHRTQGKYAFAKGGKVDGETGRPTGGYDGDDPNDEIRRRAEQAVADSLAGKVGKSVKDMADKLRSFFGSKKDKTVDDDEDRDYYESSDTQKNTRHGKTATGDSTQTSPPEDENNQSDQSNQSRFRKYGQKVWKSAKDSVRYGVDIAQGTSNKLREKLLEVASEQLDIQKRILLQLMTGVTLSQGTKKAKVDKELVKAYKGQFRSGADKTWSAIKWTAGKVKNVAWDLPTAVGSATVHQATDALRDTFRNVGETIYRKPAKGEQIDYEHPLITHDQWKRGIYADPTGAKRIKSTSDIKGPVWDADGRLLISENDYRAGLVDAKGRAIRGIGARFGRSIHRVGEGAAWLGGKAVGAAEKFGLPGKVFDSAKAIITSPAAFASGLLKKFCDVGVKTDQGVQIKVYANDFKNGLVQYRNGKKPKTSFNINEPLYWADDPVNRANNRVGTVAISNEDIRNGLVDTKGKPISRLSRTIGAGLRIGGEFMAQGVSALFGSGTNVFSFAFNTVKKVGKALWKSKNPFIDVFVADEKGNIDPKKPALLGTGIRDGKYVFLDGEMVKSAYNIKGAVRDAETGNILITEEQVTAGVYDVKGRKLTRFAGRSIIGKAASLATNAAWHGAKFAGKLGVKVLRGLGKAASGVKKLGKWITTGVFDNIADIVGYTNNVLQESLSTIFRSNTVRRTDIEELVTKRLDTIISIMQMGQASASSTSTTTDTDTGTSTDTSDSSSTSASSSSSSSSDKKEKTGNKSEDKTKKAESKTEDKKDTKKTGPTTAKVKTGKSWFERKADDVERRVNQIDKELNDREQDRKDFGETLRQALGDFFPKRKKISGDADGDGDREGSYEDQQEEKRKKKEAASKEGWAEKLKNFFGRGQAATGAGAAGYAGAAAGDDDGDGGGNEYSFDLGGGDDSGDDSDKKKGKRGKAGKAGKPGFFRRMATKAGNLINKVPGGRFVTGAASKIAGWGSKAAGLIGRIPGVGTAGRLLGSVAGHALRFGGSALLGSLGGLGGLASGAMGALGAAAGALGTAAVAAAPVLLTGAAIAAAGYGVYKLGSWLFGGDSEISKKWATERYKAYGLDYQQHKDAFEDFEEDALEALVDHEQLDEDDLEDAAEELGLLTDEDDEKTHAKKMKYFNEWYRHRFIYVLAAYVRTVKYYLGENDLDADEIDPEEIPEEKQEEALKRFAQEYKPYISADAQKLVPTLEGYLALAGKKDAEDKKKKEDKEKAKADKAKSEETGKTGTSEKTQAKDKDAKAQEKEKDAKEAAAEKIKETQEREKALTSSIADGVKEAKKAAAEKIKEVQEQEKSFLSTIAETSKKLLSFSIPGAGLADTLMSNLTGQDSFLANAASKASSAFEAIGDGVRKALDYIPGTGALAKAGSWLRDKLGGGDAPAPILDLKGLSAANIPDGGTGDLGSYVQKFESGSTGPNTIGWDSTGGTSYGTYQIASKNGTMDKFLEYAKEKGGEFGQKLTTSMSQGTIDTGSKKGYGPDIWKQFAEVDGGEALHKLEQGFIKQTHYDAAYSQIADPEAKALIDKDRGLREALWSTSIQHGPGSARKGNGAVGIFSKTFKPGMTPEEWLTAIYEKRGTQFGRSTPQVQQSVKNRFKNELPIVLGLSKTSLSSLPGADGGAGSGSTESGSGSGSDASSTTSSGGASSGGGYSSGSDSAGAGSYSFSESPAVTEARNIPLGNVDTSSLNIQSGVDFSNLHPALQQRMGALGKAYEAQFGKKIIVTSGKRSMEDQARLYKKYGPGRAAKPNPYSPHISGVALDADSSQMNKAESAGLLDQFGLYRPLKNGLGRTRKEPWHVELVGSRDPKTLKITEETLKTINAAQFNPSVGEEGSTGDAAAQDTSASGTDAPSLTEQKQEATDQKQASAKSTTSTPTSTGSGSSSSSASSSSAASSATSAAAASSAPDSAPVTTAPSTSSSSAASAAPSTPTATSAPTSSPSASSDIAKVAESSLPSSSYTPGSSLSTPASSGTPSITTTNPATTSSSVADMASSEQLQEQKLTNQILETLGSKLDQLVEAAKRAANVTQSEKSTDQKSVTTPTATNAESGTGLSVESLTSAFSSALTQAFAPGTPIYSLFSNLGSLGSNPNAAQNNPSTFRSTPQPVQPGIDVRKSNRYDSMRT